MQSGTAKSLNVFIYYSLKAYWKNVLPDSRVQDKIYIIDSTVITLFQEIFKGSGSSYADGRRKGGLKVHMAVPLYDQRPDYLWVSDGAANDTSFTKHLALPAGSTVVMDRGYRDYRQYNLWTSQHIRWITLAREEMHYRIISKQTLTEEHLKEGFEDDLHISMGYPQPKTPQVQARVICYTDKKTKKHLKFLTNDLISDPQTIAGFYKKRWDIECIFKRLKQNMPLHFFLGDNKNAIQIQIWCAMIADLLISVLLNQVKRKWSFSNVVSVIRLHLFNYLNLISFLENPEPCTIRSEPYSQMQLKLRLSG